MSETGGEPFVKEREATARAASRLGDPTGVPNLDRVLGGGLPRGALVLVVGAPGSGKTTLALQMAFAAARAGRRVLILTALSEPTSKLIGHLRTFTFFDEDLLGDAIQVLSLQQFLPQGLASTADEVQAEVRRTQAGLVIIDGFHGMRSAEGDPQRAREFLYEIGTALGVRGATTVITSEAAPRDAALFPEATTADVLVGVHYGLDGLRQHRYLEAIKVRGAAPLPGLHAMTIAADGVTIYPRLEARVIMDAGGEEESDGELTGAAGRDARTVQEHRLTERVPFALPECDALLGGGLTRETSTLVLGNPGTGKTLLALHWALAGVDAGDLVLYLGFRENRRQLLLFADAFALGPRLRAALRSGGGLTLLRLPPVELDVDVVADRLLAALEQTGARRLVIDSIAELERTVARGDPGRVGDYLAALVEALRARRLTTLVLKDTAALITADLAVAGDTLSVLAENVVVLQLVTYRNQLHRVVSVPKMRFSAHELRLREFTITAPTGIQVRAPGDSEAGVLAGIARQQGGPAAAGEDMDRTWPREGS
jgi:circadian clock protein KaiC